MKKLLQFFLGFLGAIFTFWPIVTVFGVFFYYTNIDFPFLDITVVLVAPIIQTIISAMIIRKSVYQNIGYGIIAGAAAVTLFAIFLTPLLGV